MTEKQLPHHHDNNEELEALMTQIVKINNFQIAADTFKQLGDCSRLRIFWLLCHCEECVINISAMVDMSSPAVSHHLKQLKTAGLITSQREGKEMYYTASQTSHSRLLHHTIEKLMEIICPE